MKAHPFLWKYKLNIESLKAAEPSSTAEVDVETEPEAKRARTENCDSAADAAPKNVRSPKFATLTDFL